MKEVYFDKQKHETKKSSPGLWESGCDVCKKSFKEEEEFVRVDVDGTDEVYGYHKETCFQIGMQNLANEWRDNGYKII